jgi:hypothetical protein
MKTSQTDKGNRALEIVRVAKGDRTRANALVLAYIRDLMPQLGAESAEITESKLSLNSVNGKVVASGKRYFFKFHAEESETESLSGSEYYNSKLLAELGLPVIQPIFTSQVPGSQFVLYEYLEAPTAFDEYEQQELQYLNSGSYDENRINSLFLAESALCQKVVDGYLASLELTTSTDVADSTLNQLFFTRLVGSPENPPRLLLYYRGNNVTLPGGQTIPFDTFAKMRWTINGVRYDQTLEELITNAIDVLNPRKEDACPTVIGHGDDHNGNKFFVDRSYLFFDPAFAGRQQALLSFIKATAHNTLLHPLWLYDPQKLSGKLKISFTIENDEIRVDHNWAVEERSPLRLQILRIYTDTVWRPLIVELSRRGWLPSYWKQYLRSALFCCPFLVKNLVDPKGYDPEQSLLALARCIEIGSTGSSEALVDRFLTSIEPKSI